MSCLPIVQRQVFLFSISPQNEGLNFCINRKASSFPGIRSNRAICKTTQPNHEVPVPVHSHPERCSLHGCWQEKICVTAEL